MSQHKHTEISLRAVYGTLKEGYALNPYYMKDSKKLGEQTLQGYSLYVAGIPFAVEDLQGTITVQVFDMQDYADRHMVDSMEMNAGYKLHIVPTKWGDAVMYLYDEAPEHAIYLDSGDY